MSDPYYSYTRPTVTNLERFESYRAALEQLPPDEQIILLEMAERIVLRMRVLNKRAGIGIESALEILARLGIWMNKNDL